MKKPSRWIRSVAAVAIVLSLAGCKKSLGSCVTISEDREMRFPNFTPAECDAFCQQSDSSVISCFFEGSVQTTTGV